MSMLRVIVWLFLMLLSSSFTDACLAVEALMLAKDGNANAVIVLPSGAASAARETGDILADHLKQICGGEFRVVGEGEMKHTSVKDQRVMYDGLPRPSEGNDENATASEGHPTETLILLGEGRLTKLLGATSADLGPGGILIRTFPNAIVLLGPGKTAPTDPYGTRYAVTTAGKRHSAGANNAERLTRQTAANSQTAASR